MLIEAEKSTMARGASIAPSAFYALEFNLKVSAGIYSKEKVKCFCGSKKHTKITEKDRYGIDYSLRLCTNCGILYSSPRLTNDSLKLFYKNDYRGIYSDRGEVGDIDNGIKDLVYRTIENYELSKPKVVFEIGCGTGSTLEQFKECECTGVDYDSEAIRKGKLKFLDVREGGIEILEQLGKKADLIIMNHVVEHMTDLEKDLKRVRNLLADDGILYIAVPGLYMWDINSMFQNAHNYQFNSNTLYYVMHICGFSEYYLTEEIKSIWHKDEFQDKKISYKEEYKLIESYLFRKDNKYLMPAVRMNSKFELKEVRENIAYTIKSGIPEISELVNAHPDSEAILITGGPSVNSYVGKIKELISKGAKVYSIERMYHWCINNGIIPDYVVALDASDDVKESFTDLNKDTAYLIVSHVKKDVVDALKGYKAYYYHLRQKGIDLSRIYNNTEKKRITFINTGASVSLCCLNIAMTMGANKFHMFGFDCHVTNGNYAKDITGVGDIQGVLSIEIEDRVFKTTAQYYAFMQQFFQMYQTGKNIGTLKDIKLYGDSMAKHAAKIDIDGDK